MKNKDTSEEKILLAHGSGGKLMHDLIEGFIPELANPILEKLDDSAVFEVSGRLAFTTDSYTVNPLFFPAGTSGGWRSAGRSTTWP